MNIVKIFYSGRIRNRRGRRVAIQCRGSFRGKRVPSLEKAIADGGYQGKLTADEVQQQARIPLEIR